MNLDEAIERHTAWKVVFRTALEKRETLDADGIRRDNGCALGKWLHGAGRQAYGRRVSYAELLTAHESFHRHAGKVADAINAKNYEAAEQMLGVWSEYMDASVAVVDAIEALQLEVGPAAGTDAAGAAAGMVRS
jgi:methyl-accepting chemotaxis protein